MSLISMSDAKAKQLDALLAWWGGKGNSLKPKTTEQEEIFQASDVYVAKPSTSAGIEAFTSTTSVTNSIGKAGEAVCDIYQVVNGELLPILKTQTVHNISGSVSQDPIIITRDKFGKWLAVVGGEAKTVRFQIVSSDPACLTAIVTIQGQSFIGVAGGSTVSGTLLTVHDALGGFLNDINVDLTAAKGYATWMTGGPNGTSPPIDANADLCDSYLEGRWEITSLSCRNVACI